MDLLSKGTAALRESVERGVEAVRASPLLAQSYDIGERKYTLRKQVAQGGFATVFAARDDRGAEWAVKRMLLHRQEARKARTEVALLKPLAHPNLVHLEAAALWTKPTGEVEVALILEWCNGGSLSEHLWNRRASPLVWDEVLTITDQLAAAVNYLHALKPPLFHRDIKAENLLLHSSGQWKLCDFGSATTVVLGPANTEAERAALELDVSQSTTEMLRAPEQVDLYRGLSIAAPVDLWAIGCVLFQCAVGRLPFDQRLGILNGAYRIPEDLRHPPALASLIRDLLHQDPARRITASALVKRLAACKAGNTAAWPANTIDVSTAAPLSANSVPSSTSSALAPATTTTKSSTATKAELFAALDWVPAGSPSPAPPVPVPATFSVPKSPTSAAPAAAAAPMPDPFASLDWMAVPSSSATPPVPTTTTTTTITTAAAPISSSPSPQPPSLAPSKSAPAIFDFFEPVSSPSPSLPKASAPAYHSTSALVELSFNQAPSSAVLAPTHAKQSASSEDLFAAFTAPPPPLVAASPVLSHSPSSIHNVDLFAALNGAASSPSSTPLPTSATISSQHKPAAAAAAFKLAPTPRPAPTPTTAPGWVTTEDLFASFDSVPQSIPQPNAARSPSPLLPSAPTMPSPKAPSPATSNSPLPFPLLDNTPASLPPDQIRLLLSELAYLRTQVEHLLQNQI